MVEALFTITVKPTMIPALILMMITQKNDLIGTSVISKPIPPANKPITARMKTIRLMAVRPKELIYHAAKATTPIENMVKREIA